MTVDVESTKATGSLVRTPGRSSFFNEHIASTAYAIAATGLVVGAFFEKDGSGAMISLALGIAFGLLTPWAFRVERRRWEMVRHEVGHPTSMVREATRMAIAGLGWELNCDCPFWLAARTPRKWLDPYSREITVVYGDSYLLFHAVRRDTKWGRGLHPDWTRKLFPQFREALESALASRAA